MKLASLKVPPYWPFAALSRDLKRAVDASDVAPTLQVALEKGAERVPGLRRLSEDPDRRRTEGFAFGGTTSAKRRFVPSQAADGAAA